MWKSNLVYAFYVICNYMYCLPMRSCLGGGYVMWGIKYDWTQLNEMNMIEMRVLIQKQLKGRHDRFDLY